MTRSELEKTLDRIAGNPVYFVGERLAILTNYDELRALVRELIDFLETPHRATEELEIIERAKGALK